MKILIIVLFSLATTGVAIASGDVVFSNIGPGLNAPVFDASGNRIVGPSPYVVDVFWNSDTNASMDALISYVSADGQKGHPGVEMGSLLKISDSPP